MYTHARTLTHTHIVGHENVARVCSIA